MSYALTHSRKQLLISAPALALYDYKLPTTVVSDASKCGLGAALKEQQADADWKPVAFASRALSATEQRYALTEKESLGVTWACEKFTEYALGMTFHVETDQKPLVSLLGYKYLDELSLQNSANAKAFIEILTQFHIYLGKT